MPSTVCAIISTYNRAPLLRECLDSVLAQSRKLDQIIVVNDGSTDDTVAIVRSYGDRITFIDKKNGGKAAALNLAMKECTSDYVWICDDDDIVPPDAMESLAAALDADINVDCAIGMCTPFRDENGKRIYFSPAFHKREDETNLRILLLEEMLTSLNAMLVRRSGYVKAGPFREDLIRSQDYDMTIKLLRNAKVKYIAKTVYYMREHDGVRGAATDSFPAKIKMQKWRLYDQKIFSWVRQEFRLEEFTPTFAEGWNRVAANRAALTQRACIFARREMWKEAIEDFVEAGKSDAGPATREEKKLAEGVVIRRMHLQKKFFFRNPEWIAGMRACYRVNSYSRSIIFAGCRTLVWNARQMILTGKITDGVMTIRLLIGILGMRGTISRFVVSIVN